MVITKQQNPANTRSTKDKQKQKYTKRNDSTANCDDRDDHHHPDNQPDIPSQRNKITIIGDSMLKMLNPTLIRKSLKRRIRIKTFPGARFKDMEHYIKPTLESSPDYLVIHAGTNDLKYKSTKTITKEICTLGEQAATSLPNSTLVISQVITRSDDPNLAVKIKEVNKSISKLCTEKNWDVVSHDNIKSNHLNPYGVHLSRTGTAIMARNFTEYFRILNND